MTCESDKILFPNGLCNISHILVCGLLQTGSATQADLCNTSKIFQPQAFHPISKLKNQLAMQNRETELCSTPSPMSVTRTTPRSRAPAVPSVTHWSTLVTAFTMLVAASATGVSVTSSTVTQTTGSTLWHENTNYLYDQPTGTSTTFYNENTTTPITTGNTRAPPPEKFPPGVDSTEFKIQAVLNMAWTANFTNSASITYKQTAIQFCITLQDALQTHQDTRGVPVSCFVLGFLRVSENSNNSYPRVTAQFELTGIKFSHETSERMNKIVNYGFEQLKSTSLVTIRGSVHVIRTSISTSCGKQSTGCSTRAQCIQLKDGYVCVCGVLYDDADPDHPGTNCQYSVVTITFMVLPAMTIVFALLLTLCFIFGEPRPTIAGDVPSALS